MHPTSILLPAIALAWWTIAVLTLLMIRGMTHKLDIQMDRFEYLEKFRLGLPKEVPSPISSANRNYINLFESPVLFYFSCIVLFVTNGGTVLATGFAWVYVGLRIMHSLVHVAYNRILHRGLLFALSNIVLCCLLVQATISVVLG